MQPAGTRIVSQSSSSTVLDVAEEEGSEAPDLVVGAIPLVWWKPSRGSVDVQLLHIPAPPPFDASDVSAMWEDVLRSSGPAVESVLHQGLARGGGRVRGGSWLRPEAVPRAVAACRRLLDEWPELETTTNIWRPIDMRGAREDLVATDKRAAMKPGIRSAGAVIPDRVARRHRSSIGWSSNRLAFACQSVVRAMDDLQLDAGQSLQLARPLRSVAERSMTNEQAVDLPVSSWPLLAQSTLGAVLEARMALAVRGAGMDHVPLCHVWRLYESWLVLAVAGALSPVLGSGRKVSSGSRWIWQYDLGTVTVRVHSQATIGADSAVDLSGHPDGLLSVLSDLRPDVLITVSDPHGPQAVLSIDAKRRIASTAMDASEIAAAASKYIWGIRSGVTRDTPISSAIIASSAPLPEMHDVGRSRIATCFVLPSKRKDFDALIGDRVGALIAEVGSK